MDADDPRHAALARREGDVLRRRAERGYASASARSASTTKGTRSGITPITHPNLALASERRAGSSSMTTQLVRRCINRRIAFFRPPYFGDAEPTTSDELVPVGIASRRNYWTIGLHVDAEDWKESAGLDHRARARDACIRTTSTRPRRTRRATSSCCTTRAATAAQTVAALGPLIDSLRARGDTIVLVSELAGITRDDAMPPLPPSSEATRSLRSRLPHARRRRDVAVLDLQRRRRARHRRGSLIIGLLAIVQRLSRSTRSAARR